MYNTTVNLDLSAPPQFMCSLIHRSFDFLQHFLFFGWNQFSIKVEWTLKKKIHNKVRQAKLFRLLGISPGIGLKC